MNTQFMFEGVQLLPNNPIKYIQVTDTPDGINLEDWTVKVMSLCGKELGDISESFLVEPIQVNSDNGNPQFIWSLTNIPQDFGWGLIYMKITQAVGDTFYSQPFKITNIDSEKTAQIHYKYERTDQYQSIGFTTWFADEGDIQELTSYYQVSTKTWANASIEEGDIEFWRTEFAQRTLLLKLKKILALPFVYINLVRASLIESPEVTAKVAQENFGTMDFTLNFHKNDIYEQVQESSGDFDGNDFLDDDFLIFN